MAWRVTSEGTGFDVAETTHTPNSGNMIWRKEDDGVRRQA